MEEERKEEGQGAEGNGEKSKPNIVWQIQIGVREDTGHIIVATHPNLKDKVNVQSMLLAQTIIWINGEKPKGERLVVPVNGPIHPPLPAPWRQGNAVRGRG